MLIIETILSGSEDDLPILELLFDLHFAKISQEKLLFLGLGIIGVLMDGKPSKAKAVILRRILDKTAARLGHGDISMGLPPSSLN